MKPRRLAFGVVGSAVLVVIAVTAILAQRHSFAIEREACLLGGTGWGALAALLLSLSATPIGALAGKLHWLSIDAPQIAAFRRALGLAAATLGAVHGAVALATYAGWSITTVLGRPFLRAGALTLAVLAALAITSFSSVIKGGRVRHWKVLHRLVYVAPFLAIHHLLLAPFAPRAWILAVGGITVALLLARLAIAVRSRSSA